jgi:predicted O-linked N-acetylglucosamine transferase (SPINDLY family)
MSRKPLKTIHRSKVNQSLFENSQKIAQLLDHGLALHKSGKISEAGLIYEKILKQQSNHLDAIQLLATSYGQQKNPELALKYFDLALQINKTNPIILNNRGIPLQELNRVDEALKSYEEALRLKPDYAEAHNNKGNALKELKRFDEALKSYETALLINPEFAGAHNNKGTLLQELKHFDDALQSYEELIRIQPECDFILGKMQHIRMYLCNWDNFDSIIEHFKTALMANKPVLPPFETHGLLDCPDLQKKSAEIFINEKNLIQLSCQLSIPQRKQQKIKVGYFSSDFCDHPVSHHIAGVLENHDRKKFEIIAFSLVNNKTDIWQERIIKGVDQFVDVSNKSDKEVASFAKSLELDIAVDLNGHTKNSRPRIFSYRAAPIQASYIGFLGTLGATCFDYLFADRILIPTESKEFYTEKIVYLPSYQCNDKKFSVSDKRFTRKEFGLPDDAFIFCSFNSNWKITPQIFDTWMRILKQVSNSVLWIYAENKTATENLCKEAKIRGIDPNRLIFAERLPLKEHLVRLSLADLFLDTFPYNAGATASNALRVELPLITRAGKSFVSRYGASLLTALGVHELITNSAEEFERLAIELAMRPELLNSIKEKLSNNLSKYPLFDTIKFTRTIESAFSAMHKRSQNQLHPDHIYISD